MTCSECERPADGGRGYCKMHWYRWRRHGDPSIVQVGGGVRKYTLNQEYFDSINTPEQAYWLGFITADGSVSRSKKGCTFRVQLKTDDLEHLQLLTNALGSNQPVHICNKDRGVVAQFNSSRIVNSLTRLGVIERKSLIVKPWIGPDDLMPHYWRGLFDGDGTIFYSQPMKGWCVGICGSLACVNGFAGWARDKCDSTAKVYITSKHSECWGWRVQGSRKPQRLAEALYRNETVSLARKRTLVHELCSISFA